MKSFSTMRDIQRGSQSYMEKRSGRREIEVTRRRRGGIKKGESSLASNQIPVCSPQLGTPREDSQKKWEEGYRGDQEKRESQKRKEQSSQ